MKSRLVWLIPVAVLGLACNLVALGTTTKPVETPTAMGNVTAAATDAGVIEPTTTVPVTPTVDTPQCVPSQAHESLPDLSYQEYPLAILDYLNAGASVSELSAALEDAQAANQPAAVEADMTGDGKSDVVVSLIDPTSNQLLPTGMLLFYLCQQDHYGLVARIPAAEFEGSPQIRYFRDLNADGRADLVASGKSCGAHTCFENLQILVWNRNAIENRLQGSTTDLPYPEIRVSDPEGDGVYNLEVTGTGAGSVGAGPPRSLTRVWAFSPASGYWEPVNEYLGKSNFRIHVLYDADSAARDGDFVRAQELYRRVIEDASLQAWMDPVAEQRDLAAYARFKLIVIDRFQGQTQSAQELFHELSSSASPGTASYRFVEMATVFQNAYDQGELAAGCDAVREYVNQHSGEVLSVFDFGYGNPTYTADDICPWR